MTINYGRVLENFLEMLSAERSVSKNTLLAYENDIKDLLCFTKTCNLPLNQISIDHLEEYLAVLKSKKHFSGKTVARKISSIRQFFNFLISDGIVEKNIALDLIMPKKSQDLPKAIAQDDIYALLKTAYNIETKDGIRTATMLEMLYATGMRISELLSLKMQSLENNLKNGGMVRYLIVKGKGSKERVVILNDDASVMLKRYLEIRHQFTRGISKVDWLFPSVNKSGKIAHLTRQRFGQILKELAVNSNIDSKHISPHKIRHSFATQMLRNGANLRIVQELLGHSDISSTQIYTKISEDQAARLLIDKHPLGKQKV